MAKSAVQIEVEGMKELQKKAMQMLRDMAAGSSELERAMTDSVLKMQRRAMQNPGGGRLARQGGTPVGYVPVDTGRLRASISPIVQAYGPVLRGIVGSNVEYAPFMEFGTRPHWPPRAALEVWAQRHNTTAYLVCRAIARKGTKAHRFFRAAVEENQDWVQRRFAEAVSRIVKKKP